MVRLIKSGCLSALLVLGGCTTEPQDSSVEFMLTFDGKPLTCDETFDKEGLQWQLRAFQFYVSDVTLNGQDAQLKNASGNPAPAAMLGTRCSGDGRWTMAMEPIDTSESGALSFMIGLPFEINHQNPLHAEEPLNHSDMFWTWQLGHKFIRMDIRAQSEESANNWAFHLGSIGCDAASSMRAPAEACAHPNTFTVTLDDYQSGKPVYFQLDKLISGAQILENGNCMGDPDDLACAPLIQTLKSEQIESSVFSQSL